MDRIELPPETLFHIGGFLERGSLATCIRVCKSWNAILVPMLFRAIDETHRQPSVEVFTRHTQHVRKLQFSTGSPFQALIRLSAYAHSQCHNLQELDLSFDFEHSEMDEERQSAKEMILSNKNLQKLWIEEYETYQRVHRACWSEVLSGCNRSLKVLCLTNVWLSAEDTLLLWEFAPTLQKLKLELGISQWSGSFIASPQFPQLTSLCLKDALPSVVQEMEWMKQCPNLHTLDWSSSRVRHESARDAFTNFGTYRWSHLQDINIWGDNICSDHQIACLLKSCGPLKCLRICNSNFWYESLDALTKHFGTLETLSLRRTDGLQFWMIQWVLISCPKLKVMITEIFPAQEFVQCEGADTERRDRAKLDAISDALIVGHEKLDGENDVTGMLMDIIAKFASIRCLAHVRPWVCSELEHLQGNIALPSTAKGDWDQAVYRQLSKLTKLKHLVLSEEFEANLPDSRAVRVDLRSGLKELAPVRDLESLMFDGSEQHMEREDVQWILDQWPKLKDISSDFNVDYATSLQLQSMVQKTGRNIYMTTVFDSDLDADTGSRGRGGNGSDIDDSDIDISGDEVAN